MSDATVAELLRSDLPLVTVEAAAGCGKTHQGAQFATDAAPHLGVGRVLILTHTHAARSVFAQRTKTVSGRVAIRTIDSFLTEIASIYHRAIDLPVDVGTWARENDRYDEVASRSRHLLEGSSLVAEAAAQRYPVILCDEHQDASSDQHQAIMAIHKAGARLRVFGDPMQVIFGGNDAGIRATLGRWEDLKGRGASGELLTPHRWSSSSELGAWILAARKALKDGGRVDLTGQLPKGLSVHFAENCARVPHKSFSMTSAHRKPIDHLVRRSGQLLVLTESNDRVGHLNAFFDRSMRIWEGHRRENLARLITCIRQSAGDVDAIVDGFLGFVEATGKGFTLHSHGDRLKKEVKERCSKATRGVMPGHLQSVARLLIAEPDHCGVAQALSYLFDVVDRGVTGFSEVELNLKSEIRDAIRLGQFPSVDAGFAEITRRRTFSHPQPPRRCLSTIHKSKGLECDNALMLLCDRGAFSDTLYKRRLFYVGMSRAKKELTLVLSRDNPSPLLKF
ncbi:MULTISPECIES: UvrD-helicase domain-containing protein [unclassified Bradyrhizobium]|uniref:UvrD-helicase domain-containing protein n=1 Tax=unclassified Bradyrhizobium TaxID=2631580 RepID=UPI0029164562|nr:MULTISPECIES: UvrD-helicase domain-containing protein [unclassified Bradyrhizobium]